MDYKQELEQVMEEINYCNKMIRLSRCLNAKQYFINQVSYKLEQTIDNFKSSSRQPEKQFTLEELAKFDGSMGKPAYVAVNGTVYDVSWNDNWSGGAHFGIYAGKELSTEFIKHHDNKFEILKKLPIVGMLK